MFVNLKEFLKEYQYYNIQFIGVAIDKRLSKDLYGNIYNEWNNTFLFKSHEKYFTFEQHLNYDTTNDRTLEDSIVYNNNIDKIYDSDCEFYLYNDYLLKHSIKIDNAIDLSIRDAINIPEDTEIIHIGNISITNDNKACIYYKLSDFTLSNKNIIQNI